MKSLINKVRRFNRKADDKDMWNIIRVLGESPSIATLEAVVKYYKGQLRQILGKDLLEWMQENDQTDFENDDLKVSIKTYVSAKIADPQLGFKWLEDHQYGDLIKDTLEFPKGEFSSEAEKALEEMGLSYTQKRGVSTQSLKKIISDRLKAGEELPYEEDDGIKIGYYDECVVREK